MPLNGCVQNVGTLSYRKSKSALNGVLLGDRDGTRLLEASSQGSNAILSLICDLRNGIFSGLNASILSM
jgi:hypothetical protein